MDGWMEGLLYHQQSIYLFSKYFQQQYGTLVLLFLICLRLSMFVNKICLLNVTLLIISTSVLRRRMLATRPLHAWRLMAWWSLPPKHQYFIKVYSLQEQLHQIRKEVQRATESTAHALGTFFSNIFSSRITAKQKGKTVAVYYRFVLLSLFNLIKFII